MDLFGPVNVMSMSKKRYDLVIVDDYSKYIWVLFLHSKDETPQMVIDILKLIELDSKFPVRVIRSYNGTEFKKAVLNDFCVDKGITRQYSSPRTLQQNGLVEKKNRTLIETARTMLSESKHPIYFWAKAINTACYTQNRTLINKDLMKTPYEIMNDKKPTLKYFHVFGAKCFVLKDGDDRRGKFEAKAYEAVFVGYSRRSYRVYIIGHYQGKESVNITFDDTKLPSIQTEDASTKLKFNNLSDPDCDDNMPTEVVANDNNDNNDNNDDDHGDVGACNNSTKVNISTYRGMIGSLLYLTASRPDIMYATCLCARFQADPRDLHQFSVKRILRYLKGTPNLGIWYPKEAGFNLIGYTYSDYAGSVVDRKSTSGSCQFLGSRLGTARNNKQFQILQQKQNILLLKAVVLRS